MDHETDTVSRAEFEALRAELAELKLSRIQKAKLIMQRNKRAFVAAVSMGLIIPAAISALSITKTYTFTAGDPTVASEVNANFDQLFTKVNDLAAYHPPIGAIIAWHKNEGSTPGLPTSGEWVECNGQILGSIGSVYDGHVIPNLNGDSAGANSPGQSTRVPMFLRGGLTSGTGQQDTFQGHWHAGGYSAQIINQNVAGIYGMSPGSQDTANLSIAGPISDTVNGPPRTGGETRPVNMSVVWIMKVK